MAQITDNIVNKYNDRQTEGRAGVEMGKGLLNTRTDLQTLLDRFNAILSDPVRAGAMQSTLTPEELVVITTQAQAAQVFVDSCNAIDPPA